MTRRAACDDDGRRDYPEDDEDDAGVVGQDEVTSPEALDRGLRVARAVLIEGKSVHAAAAELSIEPEAALVLMIEVRRYLDGAIVTHHLMI